MITDRHYTYRVEWLWAFFPAFVGFIVVLLLAEFNLIEFEFNIHDVDTLIILLGMSITIAISSVLISRETIRHARRKGSRIVIQTYADDHTRFLQRLDHEIKNPLMGIKTALDNLVETADPVKKQHIRDSISVQIDHLSRLVSDLRKISEIDTRQLDMLSIDTNSLLQDAFSLAEEHPLSSERNLKMQLHASLPQVHGDYDLLLLAIYNLLSNAIKYSAKGDRITLRSGIEDAYIVIDVEDTGPGIDAKELPYVWDELYRSHNVKSIAGSGIGLSLVKRIIERHKGIVSIRSTLGQGTTVSITLPKKTILD
ncbi:MAG: HAMP domain-containing histidine kinase [Anaerolineaceae bacterium]|nr:HAMP domain-containing histidine kinase [Anaerolineaceae bacterium]